MYSAERLHACAVSMCAIVDVLAAGADPWRHHPTKLRGTGMHFSWFHEPHELSSAHPTCMQVGQYQACKGWLRHLHLGGLDLLGSGEPLHRKVEGRSGQGPGRMRRVGECVGGGQAAVAGETLDGLPRPPCRPPRRRVLAAMASTQEMHLTRAEAIFTRTGTEGEGVETEYF